MLKDAALIYQSSNSAIYFRPQSEFNAPAIVKIFNKEIAHSQQIAQFNNEFDLLKSLNIKGVRKAYKVEKIEHQPAIWLEYIVGKTLKEFFSSKQHSLNTFFKCAISAARVLSEVHRHNIIHKDITPNNLIFNPETEECTIIDFGISSRISLKVSNLGNPEHLEGTLAYISPEQTGRMNRPVDYRSDLYSLGVVFYEILAEVLPFDYADPLEMVHAHLAKQPTPIYELDPKVPVMLSKIVLKLMAKNAEERYRSAFGLLHDLETCFKAYTSTKKIQPFELGLEDYSGQFQIHAKLYGRERELSQLLEGFRHCCSGHKELLLVSGAAGAGKSALVHEIHKPVTEKKGTFIEGKFDQFQRNVPYSAWLQAFNSFINLILTENTERILYWEKCISNALGAQAAVLIELLPNLQLIVGEQQPVPALGAIETQNRFNYTLRNFVVALARAEHPLVVFIDDWQWADQASINLLELLMNDASLKHFMLVSAFRNNEVTETHPLHLAIKALEKQHFAPDYIEIDNLSEEDTSELVADAMLTTPQSAKVLAKIVFDKTQGNPFFLNQFLQALYEEGLLTFSYETKRWEADILRINGLNITDNVVDLMAAKVAKLDPETKKLLEIAACMGSRFDLETLKQVAAMPHEVLFDALETTLQEGLVIPLSEAYKYAKLELPEQNAEAILFKFAHDRIQQAVLSLMSKTDKSEIHLRIGRHFLTKYTEEGIEERVFSILQQFNSAFELLKDPKERQQIAVLNMTAARRAKSSVAYVPAQDYLDKATSLTDIKNWAENGDFLRELYLESMELAYLNRELEKMESLARTLLEKTRNIFEQVKIYEIRIAAYFAAGELFKSVEIGLETLRLLGIKLPKSPKKVHILVSLLKTRTLLMGKSADDIMRLPLVEDDKAALISDILAKIIPAAYFATRELYVLLVLKTIRLTIKHGLTPASTFALCVYGGLNIGLFNSIKYGYTFARLGALLTEKPQLKAFSVKTLTTFSGFVKHWRESIYETITDTKNLAAKGLEQGDFEYTSNALLVYVYAKWLVGEPIEQFLLEVSTLRQQVGELGQRRVMLLMDMFKQMALNLAHKTERPTALVGEAFNENDTEILDANSRHRLFMTKGYIHLLYHDFETANKHFAVAREYLPSTISAIVYSLHFFLESLGLAAVIKPSQLKNYKKELALLKKNIKLYEVWAENAPSNASHRYYLLQAEWARLHRREGEARVLYDDAISAAKENRYLSDEAVIYECAGRFYLYQHQINTARYYLQDALATYQKWGAHAKVQHFKEIYGQHLNLRSNDSLSTSSTSITSSTTVHSTLRQTSRTGKQFLDVQSILKASQALSGEIMLSRLLEKLTLLIMENAGAQKVLLIDCRRDEKMIQAEGYVGGQVKVLHRENVEISNKVPLNVLNFVFRTRRFLVLDDAENDSIYNSESYIKNNKVKSVICLPIINKGVLNEMLYLENNLSVGAFAGERVETLNALTAQIAISIENALLYENLEEKVRERTGEVVAQKEIIERKNEDITDSINYAQRIQRTMLPTLTQIRAHIPDFFVFFRPRDIVSGDFYWFVVRQDIVFLAAVDCTGHGVPGAFMSMIGNGLLQQIVFEKQITEPERILEKLRKGVRNTLKQGETDNRDGMDIALCAIDKKQKVLNFAGAKLSLLAYQNGEQTEYKGDNIIIGGDAELWSSDKPFTKHQIDILQGSKQHFYLSSDGYHDQFGGSDGKKFMKKRLKELLLNVHTRPVEEQEQILEDHLKKWMGQTHKQVDDIMVIGFSL